MIFKILRNKHLNKKKQEKSNQHIESTSKDYKKHKAEKV